jgi:hypothetical protein
MRISFLSVVIVTLSLAACQQTGSPTLSDRAGLLAPAPVAATSVERPYRAKLLWTVERIEWAGVPFTPATSVFGGRCSVPSHFLITATLVGESTHGGRFDGAASHCEQLGLAPESATTYTDGRFLVRTANGDTLDGRYDNGTVDPQTGALHDTFVFTGGTGRFDGATGGGEDHGQLPVSNFEVMPGTAVPFEQNGTITYAPGRGER